MDRISQTVMVDDEVAVVMNFAVGAIDISHPDRITVSGISVCGEGIRDSFIAAIKQGGKEAYQEQGIEAFKTPKVAATAHEAGHIVVGTSLGYVMRSARLIEYQPGLWGGLSQHKKLHKIGAKIVTSAESLRQARMLYAGAAAEKFLRADFRHAASSLDEIVMSQIIVSSFVDIKDEQPEIFWQQHVHEDVIARLQANYEPLKTISRDLFCTGRLAGQRLRELLTGIKSDDH